MNKPKVVRIEKKESSSVGSWKQVAYEYYTYWNGSWKNYFTSGNGGTGDYTDYLLNYTVAATSEKTSSTESNRNRIFYYFAHTGGNYQGVSQTRNDKYGSSAWEFINKTFNDFSPVTGTPQSKTFFFATDNDKSSGLEKYSDNWEYDSWARVTKTWRKLGSNGIDPTTWYQYVGAPSGYSDPFSKFSSGHFNNPYSSTYSDRFTSYKCMQLIGAVRYLIRTLDLT
jgi:hypothetical protein